MILQFGDVQDIIILKDKVTGQPRGCAFVSYATKEEAEAAIASLNKGVHLPGALCPMEVRPLNMVVVVAASAAGSGAAGWSAHSEHTHTRSSNTPQLR